MDRLRRQHDALHRRREPWQASALDAMHELTRLTAADAPPRTGVRLSEQTLRRLDEQTRRRAGQLLREAADLGAFDPQAGRAPWHGAALATAAQASDALTSARRLATRLLPALLDQMQRLSRDAGLPEPSTVAECGRQIDLLVGVRTTLDAFTPAVYERPLTDMVAATAPARWRADRGITMGLWERRRWERQARELLRPGGSLGDLHTALVAAEEQRAEWQRRSSGGGWPTVPTGLPAADAAYTEVLTELAALEPVLAGTPDGADLPEAPLPQLRQRLDRLAGDPRASEVLPRLTDVLAALQALGLQPLVEDLRQRACPAERVPAELQLAWWRSLLEALLSTDRDLAAAAGGPRELLAEVDGGERRRQASVVRQVREALRTDPQPVTATSTLALPSEVHATARYDVVVLADAHRIPAAEAALALARARQVLLLGDPTGLPPEEVAVRPSDPEHEDGGGAGTHRPAVLDLLGKALPSLRLRHQHRLPAQLAAVVDRAVPAPDQLRVPAPPSAAHTELVTVPEVPGARPGDGADEDTGPEVRRTVALVLEHARCRPGESLAVLTPTRRHARRIADALRADLPEHPDVARWLSTGAPEPFVVTDARRGEDAVRDHVVLAVGLPPARPGQVQHAPDPLGDQDGDRPLALALSRARRRLTVVSARTAADLGTGPRPGSAAGPALRAVLAHLEAGQSPPSRAAQLPADPLLADLAARLVAAGATATVPDGRGPDLLLPPAGPVRRPVAVLTDLAGAPGPQDLLERHVVLPDQLSRFGWQVVRLSAVELFTDPQGSTERVLEAGA